MGTILLRSSVPDWVGRTDPASRTAGRAMAGRTLGRSSDSVHPMRGLLAVVALVVAVGCSNPAAATPSSPAATQALVSPSHPPSDAPSASPAGSDGSSPSPLGELERTALDIVTGDGAVGPFLDAIPFGVERVLIDADQLHLLLTFEEAINA